jgi:DNA-binding NtrC family response regulator
MTPTSLTELVGEGAWVRQLKDFIRNVSARRQPVLLLGESGTGKESVARSIHFASRRRSRPFIAVDAALYYDRELERELFGVADPATPSAGQAGLLEFSSHGTCYIACVEELSPAIQERLVEYLVTGRVRRVGTETAEPAHARLILSSTRNLGGLADGGLFSRALFDLCRSQALEMTPLRLHPEDIVPFALHTAATAAVGEDRRAVEFAPEALEILKHYPWPGNFDELRSEILRLLRIKVQLVSRELLAPEIVQHWLGRQGVPQLRQVIEEIESYIQEFRILVRLDAEYGDVLLSADEWDLKLKCYDRVP